MLDQDMRAAILRLHRRGGGVRAIARALQISKNSVKRVLRDGESLVPALSREDPLAVHLDLIRQLFQGDMTAEMDLVVGKTSHLIIGAFNGKIKTAFEIFIGVSQFGIVHWFFLKPLHLFHYEPENLKRVGVVSSAIDTHEAGIIIR